MYTIDEPDLEVTNWVGCTDPDNFFLQNCVVRRASGAGVRSSMDTIRYIDFDMGLR